MTLFRSLFKLKMNRTIYLILITSISFFFIFYVNPSLPRVYANLADLISGETVQYSRFGSYSSTSPDDAMAMALANGAANASGSYDSPSNFHSPKPLTLIFISIYLLFHSIILTLVSIPRMNDCRANCWLTLFLLIPELNYIIVLLLTLLPKAKHADQVRSSIWSDLGKAQTALILLIVVGFTIIVFGTLLLYAVQMTYFPTHREAPQ